VPHCSCQCPPVSREAVSPSQLRTCWRWCRRHSRRQRLAGSRRQQQQQHLGAAAAITAEPSAGRGWCSAAGCACPAAPVVCACTLGSQCTAHVCMSRDAFTAGCVTLSVATRLHSRVPQGGRLCGCFEWVCAGNGVLALGYSESTNLEGVSWEMCATRRKSTQSHLDSNLNKGPGRHCITSLASTPPRHAKPAQHQAIRAT
jgi:hypothetical protein